MASPVRPLALPDGIATRGVEYLRAQIERLNAAQTRLAATFDVVSSSILGRTPSPPSDAEDPLATDLSRAKRDVLPQVRENLCGALAALARLLQGAGGAPSATTPSRGVVSHPGHSQTAPPFEQPSELELRELSAQIEVCLHAQRALEDACDFLISMLSETRDLDAASTHR